MKLKQISPENRPRERLEKQGPQSLSNSELLAIILKSGTKKENIIDLCHNLLSKYGLAGLAKCSMQELTQEHGIGIAKACQIIAMFELSRRNEDPNITNIKKVKDIILLYKPKLRNLQQEHFVAVYLDSKNNIITDQTITKGIVNASLIHPREVFHGAIKSLASSVIVLHNHPSGDPTPSAEDLDITKRLVETGNVMGIPLLDHVIIAKELYWSWKENNIK